MAKRKNYGESEEFAGLWNVFLKVDSEADLKVSNVDSLTKTGKRTEWAGLDVEKNRLSKFISSEVWFEVLLIMFMYYVASK